MTDILIILLNLASRYFSCKRDEMGRLEGGGNEQRDNRTFHIQFFIINLENRFIDEE